MDQCRPGLLFVRSAALRVALRFAEPDVSTGVPSLLLSAVMGGGSMRRGGSRGSGLGNDGEPVYRVYLSNRIIPRLDQVRGWCTIDDA